MLHTKLKKNISDKVNRIYYLDWLRTIAILFVFFIHCAKFFDFHTTSVYSTDKSLVLSMAREYILIWIMPLFFIISGGSISFSLKSRKTSKLLKERFFRIFVPLIFIGTFIINPPQVYIERLFKGQTFDNFFQWYPQFFNGIYLGGGNFAPLGIGTHLWYLLYLFIFTLIFLPLFITSKKSGKSIIGRLSIFFEKPIPLFLLFIPISLIAVLAEKIGIGVSRVAGGWDIITYTIFFIFGYLIFSNSIIQETIKKYYKFFLFTAIVLTIMHLDVHFGINLKIDGITRHDLLQNGKVLLFNQPMWMVVLAFKALLAWLWIIAILGIGQKFFKSNNSFIRYTEEANLPFYILHHTIVIVFGYYIISWDINIFTRFFILSVTSFIAIIAVYETMLKPFNTIRFLYGMKQKKSNTKRELNHE